MPYAMREAGQCEAELGFRVLWILSEDVRHRECEVVSNEVIGGVPDEDTGEHPATIAAVLGVQRGQRGAACVTNC